MSNVHCLSCDAVVMSYRLDGDVVVMTRCLICDVEVQYDHEHKLAFTHSMCSIAGGDDSLNGCVSYDRMDDRTLCRYQPFLRAREVISVPVEPWIRHPKLTLTRGGDKGDPCGERVAEDWSTRLREKVAVLETRHRNQVTCQGDYIDDGEW